MLQCFHANGVSRAFAGYHVSMFSLALKEVPSCSQEGAEAPQGGNSAGAVTLPETSPAPLQAQERPNKRQKVASMPFLRDGEVQDPYTWALSQHAGCCIMQHGLLTSCGLLRSLCLVSASSCRM